MIFGSIKKHHESEYEVEADWEIKNFLSHLKGTLEIRSPPFTWSSNNWMLEIRYKSDNRVAAYVFRTTEGKQIPVVYKFFIRLMDGTTEMRCSFIKSFGDSSSSSGVSEFILKSDLEERKQELLPAGILTVSCILTHVDTLIKPQNFKYESKYYMLQFSCFERNI